MQLPEKNRVMVVKCAGTEKKKKAHHFDEPSAANEKNEHPHESSEGDVLKKDYNLYEGLQVSHDADTQTIKTAFIKRSLEAHPDKPSGDAACFERISKAKTILLDDELRGIYDSKGFEGLCEHEVTTRRLSGAQPRY